jgi:predicted amidohydrolase
VPLDDVALAPLVEACAATGALALVDAPIEDEGGQVFIASLRIDGAGVRVAYRKSWVGGREAARFARGDGPTVLEVDGWRLGLSICRDTGAAQHTVGTAALGVDVYVAGLVHRPEELPEQEARAVVIARTCRAYVVFASFAGPTGDVFSETAGCSAIWSPDGRAVARTGRDVENAATATLN